MDLSRSSDVEENNATKEVVVTWLSEEECIAAGATDMNIVSEYVEKVNIWLAEGKVVEPELLHLLWEKEQSFGKRIGVHAALIQCKSKRIGNRSDIMVESGNVLNY
jgi:hypothetical protein